MLVGVYMKGCVGRVLDAGRCINEGLCWQGTGCW